MQHKKYIDTLLSYLDNKVEYVLLTNISNLYDLSNDIDIITLNKNKFYNAIKNFLQENKNINLIQKIEHKDHGDHIFFSDSDYSFLFSIDVYEKIIINNFTVFSYSYFENRNKKISNDYLPRKSSYFSYCFIKSLKKNNFNIEKILYFKKNLKFFESELIDLFPKISCDVINNLKISNISYFLKSNYLLQNLRISKNSFILNCFNYFYRRIKRIFFQKSLVIAFLGIDGSGKTTQIENINKSFLPFNHKFFFHIDIRHRFYPNSKNIYIPKNLPTYNIFLSFLKLLFLLFVHFLNIPRLLMMKTKCSLIIFDRYIYDLFLDIERYRVHKFYKILCSLIFFISYKPDIVIVLHADPKIIIQRKNENNLNAIKELNILYKSFAIKNNFVLINTSDSRVNCSKSITTIILKSIGLKNKSIFK